MFKLSEIKDLIKLVDQTSVQELEIENDGTRLFIRKPQKTETVVVAPQTAEQTPAPQAVSHIPVPSPVQQTPETNLNNLHTIISPMVGTFYKASAPGAASFVNKGDQVNSKTVVCIIEAMKLMNEIEAELDGEIVDVLVENGQLVEYGQPLFLVKQG